VPVERVAPNHRLPHRRQSLIHRLKKRKLLLKDKIYQLERLLVPDIPA
jgi:hypothetical protein